MTMLENITLTRVAVLALLDKRNPDALAPEEFRTILQRLDALELAARRLARVRERLLPYSKVLGNESGDWLVSAATTSAMWRAIDHAVEGE